MIATENTYLVIPFEKLPQAKKQAGRLANGEPAIAFDKEKKYWYARPGADLERLKAYRINTALTVEDKGDHRQQFGDFIRMSGGLLDGPPVMDGKPHRIAMEDDKKGNKSGVYVGHLDGFANGWFKDHRQPDRNTWSPTSEKPDPEVLLHRRAMAAQEQARREAETRERQDRVAAHASALYQALPAAPHTHPYLVKKGVKASGALRLDDGSIQADRQLRLNAANQLIIAMHNIHDDIRTLQAITPDGSKRLATGGEKMGNFCVVGGTLKDGQPLVLAEGYATAASAAMALEYPVVMTVDSGNLVKVAAALHARYPASPVLVLGDDDLPTPRRPKNPGRESAEEAARLTGGTALLPDFSWTELSQGLSDFNDLHQAHGLDALRDYLKPAFDALRHIDIKEEHTMKEKPDSAVVTREHVTPTDEPAQTVPVTPVDEPTTPTNTPVSSESAVDTPALKETQDAVPESKEPEFALSEPEAPSDSQTTPAIKSAEEPADMPLATQAVDTPDVTGKSVETPALTASEEPAQSVMPEPMLADEYADYAGMAEQVFDNDLASSPLMASAPEPEAPVPAEPTPLVTPAPSAHKPEEEEARPPEATAPEPTGPQEDGITIEIPGGQRRPERVDLDALIAQLTHEMAEDGKSVRYSVAGEMAFVDHGNRLAMAGPAASQDDSKILAALMVASKHYRGRIELTGSEAFKTRAMTLIAEYDLKLTMKNPQQQLQLDEARKKVADEPEPGDKPVPFGAPTDAIVSAAATPATASSTPPPASDLPPELRPTERPQAGPQHASRTETQAGLTGTLLGYGSDKYRFDQTENYSYFVHMRTAQGERYIWGKELRNALSDSGLKTGDPVTLSWLGSETVTVDAKVRDKDGNVVVDGNGVEMTEKIETRRNKWSMTPAIDPALLVSNDAQATPPGSLQAYDVKHFTALQEQVQTLAHDAGISLAPLPDPGPLLWMKPDGKGTPAPAAVPSDMKLPDETRSAGTLLMQAMDEQQALRLILVKGFGDCVQGVVKYQDAWHPVLGKVCTRENGSRYMSLNAVTTNGLQAVGYGNAISHEAGANNAFVFRLSGEKEKLYAPVSDAVKQDPALHKQLGFEQAYAPQAPQRRKENTARYTPPLPRPGA